MNDVKQETLVLIDKGRPRDLFLTAQVYLEEDCLRLLRGRSMAFSTKELGRGDFQIRAELCIKDRTPFHQREYLPRSRYYPNAAFLFSGGRSWEEGEQDLRMSAYIPDTVKKYNTFEFSQRGFYRLKGPILSNLQKDILGKGQLIDGEFFLFEVFRKGNTLSFSVDGRTIYSVDYREEELGKFGFAGLGNDEMDIRSLEARGEFKEWTAPPPLTGYGEGYNVPVVDLTQDLSRQVVVAPGEDVLSFTKGEHQADGTEGFQHPTTLLLDDGKTMFCVFTVGHGGSCGPLKVSHDGGLRWTWVQTPENWRRASNCPCIHKLTDEEGTQRLFVFARRGEDSAMVQAVSLDGGNTWSNFEENGLECVVPPITIEPISGGRLLALFDIRGERIHQSISGDGGLTWEPQREITDGSRCFSEPCIIRSPEGNRLMAILRENSFWYNSYGIISDDEGETWSAPFEMPGAVTGHRHLARYDEDGRVVMVFRDMARGTATPSDFVGWVGTYDDLVNCREGQYRLRLIANSKFQPENPGFTGYPGLERLPDGTFVATTYAVLSPGPIASIASVRFTLSEVDTTLTC